MSYKDSQNLPVIQILDTKGWVSKDVVIGNLLTCFLVIRTFQFKIETFNIFL
jgi:hypothetical protein